MVILLRSLFTFIRSQASSFILGFPRIFVKSSCEVLILKSLSKGAFFFVITLFFLLGFAVSLFVFTLLGDLGLALP